MCSIKCEDKIVKATVFYNYKNQYVLYILKDEIDHQVCSHAFVYSDVNQLITDIQILVNKNGWWNLSNSCSDKKEVETYNRISNTEEILIKGNELMIIGDEITFYPRLLPIDDKVIWSNFIMARFSINLDRCCISDIR